jgi:PiT family inorganic phosphate transporter
MELGLVITGVILALVFDFVNGVNDAANSISTVVATRVLRPLQAVGWAAFWNFAAVAIGQLKVASTIGKGVIHPESVTTEVILAALIGAIIWSWGCTALGLPISVSHALVGGLLGAAILYAGNDAVIWHGIGKIGLFIILSPLIGIILAYINVTIVSWIFRKMDRRRVNRLFRKLQLISAALFSLGHGTGDAQKTMGVVAVLLMTAGITTNQTGGWLTRASFDRTGFVPNWVVLAAFTAIALGTLLGGWKVIKTMGVRLTELRSMEAACAETAAATSILGTALFGIPVSTTHTISGAIMGVGAIRRLTAVRWGVMGNIVWAWILTIPGSAIVAALTYKILVLLLHSR